MMYGACCQEASIFYSSTITVPMKGEESWQVCHSLIGALLMTL
jgi:hypothetical protein